MDYDARLTYMREYLFPDKLAARDFVDALGPCRRRGWQENKVRVFVPGDRVQIVEDLAAKYKGEAHSDWEERTA